MTNAATVKPVWLTQVLRAAGWQGSTREAVDIIRAAVIVEESIKVGVEAEQYS